MLRRRFVLGAASAAVTAPLVGIAGCGGGDGPTREVPVPIPASASVIRLPADQYLHRGAPTEWWWHTGTLKSGSRTFGFEINAASFAKDGLGFSQLMLADVANNRHYQRTTPYLPPFLYDKDNWAQFDVTKDWSARLGDEANYLSAIALTSGGSGYTSDPVVTITGGGGVLGSAAAVRDAATGTISAVVLIGQGIGYTTEPTVTITGGGGAGATARAIHSYVSMFAPWGDPTKNMKIKARLVDDPSNAVVLFDLAMSQAGPPFIVWGTGVNPGGGSGGHLETNNYYYSLTRLQVTGTVTLDGQSLPVTGTTWMDHEYGAFGTAANPVKWILQDMQLDNGVCISNYATLEGGLPPLGVRTRSNATVQRADGTTYFVASFVTPMGRTWTSPVSGKTFYLQFVVEIPTFDAELDVTTLMDSQEFPVQGSPVYEGVASAKGTFEGKPVTGTAWNEQAI